MQDLEILIRYKCEKCGGSGAKRNETGVVIGNCSDCGGNGRHQKWVEYAKVLIKLIEEAKCE